MQAFTAFLVSVESLHWTNQDQSVPLAHQALSSRQISHGQAQHKHGSPHPISRHQYPGQEIWIYRMHHQGSDMD